LLGQQPLESGVLVGQRLLALAAGLGLLLLASPAARRVRIVVV